MQNQTCVIDAIPWARQARAPKMLKKLPNAPSHAIKVSDADLLHAIGNAADMALKRANSLIHNYKP